MSLHEGIDTVAYATYGLFTATYGSAAPANIANLYASWGLIEDAPDVTQIYAAVQMFYYKMMREQ
jgi:hypothetical protein